MYEIFLILLAFVWISFAIVSDFKKREIPDWVSYSLIIFALSYRTFVSFYTNWNFLYSGLIGFGLFFVIGNIMYRIGFGGGDTKLLMALGTILPFSFAFNENLSILVLFLVLLLVAGSIYSIIYSLFIVSMNFKRFKTSFKREVKKYRNLLLVLGGFFIISLMLYFLEPVFLVFSVFLLVCPLLFIYTKSVDDIMIKTISTRKLTIGDWLVKKVRVKGKTIEPKLTGIDELDLRLLRKYKKQVEVKNGVPFTISFLFAFLLIVWLWYSFGSLFNYNFWF